jgi:hypothetical protein
MRALNGLLSMTGADKAVAQRHAGRLWELGLEDVRGESVTRLERGEPGSTFESAYARVMPYLVQYGGLSEKDAERRLQQMGDPAIGFPVGLTSAWGRRPSANDG